MAEETGVGLERGKSKYESPQKRSVGKVHSIIGETGERETTS